MKRWVSFITLTCATGCGLALGPTAPSTSVTTEPVSFEADPAVVPPALTTQAPFLFVDADPVVPSLLIPDPLHGGDGSIDFLGVLLDALLVDLLAPVGPRLNDSMTFLERLCLEGDDSESFCRRRFGR